MRSTELQRRRRAGCFSQPILQHIHVLRHTIHIEVYTGGFSRTVVGGDQMAPLSYVKNSVWRLDFNLP